MILVFLQLLTKIKPHYPLKPAGMMISTRIQKILQFLNELSDRTLPKKLIKDADQLKKLLNLRNHLQELQSPHKELCDQVTEFYGIIDAIREIFQDDGLSEEEALLKFQRIISRVYTRLRRKSLTGKFREGYEALLKTMKSWKKKLFKFKSMPLLPRTNNSLEQLFNRKKSWLRRTSGVKQGNRTFKLFGKYIMFIDSSLTTSEIINLLNQANYEECARKLKTENKIATQRFHSKHNLRAWDTNFENFCKKVFMSAEVS